MTQDDWLPVEGADPRVAEIGEGVGWTAGSLRMRVACDFRAPGVPVYLFWQQENGKLLYQRVVPPAPVVRP